MIIIILADLVLRRDGFLHVRFNIYSKKRLISCKFLWHTVNLHHVSGAYYG